MINKLRFNNNNKFLFQKAAQLLKPKIRRMPNTWAEEERWLKEGVGRKSGRWKSYAWQKWIMNAFPDPRYRGAVVMKCVQSGGSEIAINLIGWAETETPCPILYLTTTDEKARAFSLDRFSYMIQTSPSLKTIFLSGRKHNERILEKRAIKGKLVMKGSKSVNSLKSETFRYVIIDEMDSMEVFEGLGSAYSIALGRIASFNELGKIFALSTPSTHDTGIAELFYADTTLEFWHFPCPKCGELIACTWKRVVIPDNNPELAYMECEKCKYKIYDHERWAQVEKGQYISELSEEDKNKKIYQGFQVSSLQIAEKKLCDLAKDFLSSKNEAHLRVFFNDKLGLPYTQNSEPITVTELQTKIYQYESQVPDNCCFITGGIDVQGQPTGDVEKNLTFYVDVSAWDQCGSKWLIDFKKLIGIASLRAFLRNAKYKDKNGEERKIKMSVIDAQYQSSTVYRFCADTLNHCCAIKYGGIDFIMQKKLNFYPTVSFYVLHRDKWLDRVIGQHKIEHGEYGCVFLPKNVTKEYFDHFSVLRLVQKTNRDGRTYNIWWKEHERSRDDWAHCALYSTVGAFLLGIDDIAAKNVGKILVYPNKPRNELGANTQYGTKSINYTKRTGKIRI